jgi:uncharacterized membrane protein YfcA
MLQSLCGFGTGIFGMAVLPHFFDSYSLSLVMTTLSTMVICIFIAIKEYKHINLKMIVPLTIGNISAITLIMLFWSGDANIIMKKILGLFLILLGLYFIFFNRDMKIKPTYKVGLFFGAIAGTGLSFFSIGAPPVALYIISASKSTKEYIASIQAYFCISSIYVTISRYMKGMVTAEVWPLFLAGLPFLALGSLLGLKLFGTLNEAKLRLFIYVFMAVSGAAMIFS